MSPNPGCCLQLERDALVAKTDVLERCLLTGAEQLQSNEPSPSTSAGQPSKVFAQHKEQARVGVTV